MGTLMFDVFFWLFEALLFGVGIKTLRKSLYLRRHGHFAVGSIARVAYRKIFVQFTTAKNQQVAFLAEGGSPWVYKQGDPVAVLYDPHHPKIANIYTWDYLWSLPSAFLTTGVVFLLLRIYALAAPWIQR